MHTNFDNHSTPPAIEGGKATLLLVDDQSINIQILYRAFTADYHVLMATSGSQALDICSNRPPDLILLDIEMPGMDGFEVCSKLKLNPDTQEIPVIFVTVHSDEQTETRCLQAGAVDFITKPINYNVVRARVNTHLTLKAQADLLRKLVYLDGLTGVYNRRYFDERLSLEWNVANRNKTPLSLIMIDVDFFKKYNDLYGHQQGDDCLRQVAGALSNALKRPGDLVARYGGEEFVCLLPNTELSGALFIAEKIRQDIAALRIEHLGSQVQPIVSISAGVCCKQTVAENVNQLIQQADTQLYAAKNNGRNQCSAALFHLPNDVNDVDK